MRVQESTAFLFVAQQGTLSPDLSTLVRGEPAFAAAFSACAHEIENRAGWSLADEMRAPHSVHTARDQPVVTALQIAWVSLLRSAGIEAVAAGGLSAGETAAAWCSGAIDLADAMRLALQFGYLADQDASRGGMGYLRTDWGTIGDLIERNAPEVARAVEMSGDLTVIAGPSGSVDRVITAAAARGIDGARLPFDRAYHNAEIDPLEPWFCNALESLVSRGTRIPLYSAVTRRLNDGRALTAGHWWQVARAPNYFFSMLQKMIGDGYRRFVEIGPAPMFAETARQAAQGAGARIEVVTVDELLRGRS